MSAFYLGRALVSLLPWESPSQTFILEFQLWVDTLSACYLSRHLVSHINLGISHVGLVVTFGEIAVIREPVTSREKLVNWEELVTR